MMNQNPPLSKQQAIFELMDSYSTKQALKLIAQTETKYPRSQVLKAMKVMNLHRSGDVVSAKALCLEILATKEPFTNESVVQMMWVMMRQMGLVKEAVESLRLTNEITRGQNEYVFQTYFAALLNAGEFQEMQKAAMQQFRTSKNPQHQINATMCNLLQVKPDDSSNLLLKLANMVLAKFFEDKENNRTWETAWLHIHVLRWMKSYDDALKFLATEGAATALSMETERLGFALEIFEAQGNTRGVNAVAKTILSGVDEERDNWRWWVAYFETLTAIIDTTPEGAAPVIPERFQPEDVPEDDRITTYPAQTHDETYDAARAFVNACLEKEATVASTRPRRATRLAAVHLHWIELMRAVGYTPEDLGLPVSGHDKDTSNATLAALRYAVGSEEWARCMKFNTAAVPPTSISDAANGSLQKLIDGIVDYLAWLKYKPQGYLDIVKFLPLVNWLGKGGALRELIGEPEEEFENLMALNHKQTFQKVSYALGLYDNLPAEKVQKTVHALMASAEGAAAFSSSVEYDKPAEDDALQFAALINFLQYHRTGDRRYVAQMLVTMEGCKRPKANTQLQQWQMLLNTILGVPHAPVIADQLDLKFIQMESLTYLTYSPVVALCGDKEAQTLNRKVRRFQDRMDSDFSEITMNAWHLLTCSKVFESHQLRQSLKSSLIRREVYLAAVWSAYLESCGTGASDRKLLDDLDNIPPVTPDIVYQDNKDTTCVASTLMADPTSCRSHLLKSTLLATVDASRDLNTHRVPYFLSCFHSLTAIKALLYLLADAEKKPTDAGKSKGKDKKKKGAAAPAAEEAHVDPNAVDRWQACADASKLAYEALEKVTADAVPHVVDADMFNVCNAVCIALFKFIHAATAAKDGSCAAAAAALADALAKLPAALDAASAPYKDGTFADTRGLNYALRAAVPFTQVAIQALNAVSPLAKREAAPAALSAALDAVKEALTRAAANASAFVDALGKRTDFGAILLDVCGAGADSPAWVGEDAWVAGVGGRAKEAWVKILKRLSQTASNRQFELQGTVRSVF